MEVVAASLIERPVTGSVPRAHLSATLAPRAMLPFERLEVGTPSPEQDHPDRVRAWAQNLLGREGTRAELLGALAAHGVDEDDVAAMVADVAPTETTAQAPWVPLLQKVLTAVPNPGAGQPGTATGKVAFGEVLEPFVAYVRDRLPAQGWDQAALDVVLDDLRATLSRWSGRALYSWFQARLPVRSGLDEMLARASGSAAPATEYRRFVEEMADGGLARFLHEHAFLARALAQTTVGRLEAAQELHARLVLDRPAIEASLGGGQPLGSVTAIDLGKGDPHRGGRRVATLTFESGLSVVYKPRSVGMEREVATFLRWLDSHGAPVALRAIEVIERDDYGWVEHVRNTDCADPDAVGRFYRRAGALLCLLHLLEAQDCHYENVMAVGEDPVLVDAECLFHHRLPQEAWGPAFSAQQRAASAVSLSPARTGYLPYWTLSRDRTVAFDTSGLTGGSDRRTADRVLEWVDVNTDRMSFVRSRATTAEQHNLPRLDGSTVPVGGHTTAFRDGFAATYRFLRENRDLLTAPHGPLEGFRGRSSRIVVRSTNVYGALLTMLMDSPLRQRDGFASGIVLEQLGRGYLGETQVPPTLAIERRGLYRLDVPVFTAPVDSTDLHGDEGTVVAGFFAEPSYGVVLQRLAAMGEEDLATQLRMIDAVFQCHLPGADRRGSRASATPSPAREATGTVSGERQISVARRLAHELDEQAIRGDGGSLTWIAPQFVALTERLQLRPLGPSLYDGVAGIAVFYAALHRVTGEAAYRERALGCWRTLREQGEGSPVPERPFSHLGTGAGTGIGGILYAAVLAEQLLGDPTFLDDAHALVRSLDTGTIESSGSLDVLSGTAGLLLGLLAVHRRTGDPDSLRLARACGEQLVRERVRSPQGELTWSGADGALLTGFSHGAAGITHALAQLYRETGEASYLTAAEEGVRYEQAVFDPGTGNWPDLRLTTGRKEPGVSWCHGAPGIALSRVGWPGATDTTADVEAGLRLVRGLVRDRVALSDTLCCGRVGLVDILLSASGRLGRPELREEAGALADRVAAAADEVGFTYSHLLPRGVFQPGLFVGAAGVGYEQLRLSHPDLLPSVLLFETVDAPSP